MFVTIGYGTLGFWNTYFLMRNMASPQKIQVRKGMITHLRADNARQCY